MPENPTRQGTETEDREADQTGVCGPQRQAGRNREQERENGNNKPQQEVNSLARHEKATNKSDKWQLETDKAREKDKKEAERGRPLDQRNQNPALKTEPQH